MKNVSQKFSFNKPVITNGKGETISYGTNITIEIEGFQTNDKEQIKKDLASIFAEVLEYFD